MKVKIFASKPFLFLFLSLLPCITAVNLHAQPLFSFEENSFSIKIDKDLQSTSEALALEIRNPDLSEPIIERISNPDRIVIDLPGSKLQENKNFKTDQIPLLKGIRTGNHPERLRIVLDLSDQHPTQHSWSFNQGYLVLVLTPDSPLPSSPGKTRSSAAKKKKPAKDESPGKEKESPASEPMSAEVSAEPVRLEKDLEPASTLQIAAKNLEPLPPKTEDLTEGATAVSEISGKPVSTVPPPPQESPAPEPVPRQDGKLTMQRILYDYQGEERTPVLKVVTSKPTGFTLIKKSDSLYKLDLPECDLEYEYLTLPHYPPFDFIGFTLIKVEEQNGENLAVMIGVDQGTKIKARSVKREIWISTTK